MNPKIFINYRRDDAGPEALLLRSALIERFGIDNVFMDIVCIHPGAAWPKEIEQRLNEANVVVSVIGPEWLTAGTDANGKRRIDQKSDLVRKELAISLRDRKKLIPVFVRNRKPLQMAELPPSLKKLSSIQGIPIRRDYWEHDIQLLFANLPPLASRSIKGQINDPFPKGDSVAPDRLSETKLQSALINEISQWQLVKSALPEKPSVTREELFREFRFKRFAEAISFMHEVANGCDVANHHPRWENIFKTLRVYLSTWDNSLHAVSDRDVQLARYFDRAYAEFPGAAAVKRD